MKIETYEQELESTEIAQLAADGEYAMLVDQLGLNGQRQFIQQENEVAASPVFPYRRMTKIELRVFKFHCPITTKLTEYRSEAMPVRVLQVAAHALSCNFLHHITVWHPEDAKLDPVLVGHKTEWGEELYLLARWGAVWKDFAALTEEAIKGWKRLRKAQLEKAQKEIAGHINAIDSDAELFFAGKHVESAAYFNAESA